MENTRDKYKALLASLGVHLIIFFIAAAVGVFSMATLKEKSDNVEVVIYDETQDEGSEGGGWPPPAEAATDRTESSSAGEPLSDSRHQ